MAGGVRALVRRRRDGRVVFDLDLVHAGVVAEALEQTRAVLTDGVEVPTAAPAGTGDPDDEFDAIVSRLGGVGAVDPGPRDPGTADRGTPEPGVSPRDAVPDDPVLRRLLPDAFLDDPEQSAEFRRLSGDSVRGRKVGAIDSVLADLDVLRGQGGGLVIDADRAGSWLTALNDARLALGTLLAVGEDDDLHGELDDYEQQLIQEQLVGGAGDGDEASTERALRAYRIAVYDFLSALLEMVVRALDR